jgi:hypothetical protein
VSNEDQIVVTSNERCAVRLSANAPDAFAGLIGHAYIIARNLNRVALRVQTSAHHFPLHSEGK